MSEWPIFVLTLPGDDDRRQPLLDALDGAGLSYQLFMGVDGRSGLPGEFEALVDRRAALVRLGRSMCDGELACALSHRQIYQHVVTSNLPGAVILEDDGILQQGFADFIRSGDFRHVPMVLIDHAFGRAVRFRRIALRQGELRRAAVQATTTTAYSISNETARRLLDATSPVEHPADWPCSLHALGAWLLVPRLVRHEPPAANRFSHLERERAALVECAGNSCKSATIRDWKARLRRRLSVRVDRGKGQR
ncbi:glycosyltransferase family 25 protein [Paracoccus alkanivorans]|uniref:Glycosyl transferase family 25 domain-containing protein n=1 Tax=Paracoccus alkanivorans TaxID=2116655 RepID=A0A3M0MD40_9RHOB|nr:glycosyltransferase family 25 protein [Paracoccus alkanivorans]RMC34214.1 hypothetical protein C9E81_13655 [Paracoccus alkanivorans]